MNNVRVGTNGLDGLIDSGKFSDEQYSRPCQGFLDHVVNRQLSFDYFTSNHKPFGLHAHATSLVIMTTWFTL